MLDVVSRQSKMRDGIRREVDTGKSMTAA